MALWYDKVPRMSGIVDGIFVLTLCDMDCKHSLIQTLVFSFKYCYTKHVSLSQIQAVIFSLGFLNEVGALISL